MRMISRRVKIRARQMVQVEAGGMDRTRNQRSLRAVRRVKGHQTGFSMMVW